MKWTREKPTEPGWYWFRGVCHARGETVCVCEVEQTPWGRDLEVAWPGSDCNEWLSDLEGEWAGPIHPPEERPPETEPVLIPESWKPKISEAVAPFLRAWATPETLRAIKGAVHAALRDELRDFEIPLLVEAQLDHNRVLVVSFVTKD